MQKRDQTVGAWTGLGVNDPVAGTDQFAQRLHDVVDPKGDVVQPFSALGQEAGNPAVRVGGPDQLQPGISKPQHGDLYPLMGDDLAYLELGSGQSLPTT